MAGIPTYKPAWDTIELDTASLRLVLQAYRAR